MPVGHAISAFCDPTMHWKDPDRMHLACRRCGSRFVLTKSGEGAGRQITRAICQCPCHAVTRAAIPTPEWTLR